MNTQRDFTHLVQVLDTIDPDSRIPFGTSRYYQSLATTLDPHIDPIAAQFIPRPEEAVTYDYETPDPLSDKLYQARPRLIHHYYDRALILVNDRCAAYCRHCFRRHFTGSSHGRITPEEIREICGVLSQRPQIQELLLSGGDPLMSPDEEIEYLLKALTRVNPDYIIRMATRIPVVQPQRITPKLASILGSYGNMWMVTHVNHPKEITSQFKEAIRHIVGQGIPVLNQAVLLKGVNDSADILVELFRGLLKSKVKPYYLFQGDLASGTKHFRTSLDHGLDLMDQVRSRLSGMGVPTYAVDLPDGGGKIPLNRGTVVGKEDGWYLLQGPEGKIYRYPVEE
jgi:lysine 2,3-aminomutase